MQRQTNLSLTHITRPPREPGDGPAPALLLLHGVGSNEKDLISLAPYLDPRLHIISARAPYEMGPQMFGWYMVQWMPNGDFRINEQEARQSLQTLTAFLDEIAGAYNLDPNRLFLGGFSQGAIMSSALLLTSPEKIAGIVAMSGRWPTPVEAERAMDEHLAGKPVLVMHGLYDPTIPIRYGREMRDKFAALPVDLTYQEYPIQHSVSMEGLQLAASWLTERLDAIGNREPQ
jgi:phospholipase/carboxylesterase